MKLNAFKTTLQEIQTFRALFLQETNFQIRYNACHERGWSDTYLVTCNDIAIGYCSIKGKNNLTDRDSVFEFYVIHPYRKFLEIIFSELLLVSGATFIECQSNDFLLSSLLYEFSQNINADVILFQDHVVTEYINPGVIFRLRDKEDNVFEHKMEPMGNYILELNKKIIATGGFMLYYNMPFADLYMEVEDEYRRQGFGTFLLQELKKECYLAGRVSAARCDIQNKASRATIIKAGLKVVGYMLTGDIKKIQ